MKTKKNNKKINEKIAPRDRMNAIIQVLTTAGRLEKEAITIRVAEILSVDPMTIHKPIYRDLAKLVNNNEIAVEYYSKDGGKIEDYDSESKIPVKCEWFLPDSHNEAKGHKILDSIHVGYRIPKILQSSIDVYEYSDKKTFSDKKYYILFAYNSKCVVLSFDKQDTPINLLFSRTDGTIKEIEMKEIDSKFGQRNIILKIPIAQLSSFKNGVRHCHSSMKFESNRVILKDHTSTNGTFLCILKEEEIKTHVENLTSQGKVTIKQNTNSFNNVKLLAITETNLNKSSIVYLSNEFQIIFIM